MSKVGRKETFQTFTTAATYEIKHFLFTFSAEFCRLVLDYPGFLTNIKGMKINHKYLVIYFKS